MASTFASDLKPYQATALLLAMLVAADALFMLIHAVHAWSTILPDGKYALDADLGMAELYQYVKFLWLLGCLALAFTQTGRGVYLAWAALFALLLVDDVVQLHESAGRSIARLLELRPAFGLRPVDFGELIYAAGVGVIALAVAAMTMRRGDQSARQFSADMLVLLFALAVFAVALDAVHTFTYSRIPSLVDVFALLEDGGELVVVSALTAYVFDIASNSGQQRIALWDRVVRTR